MRADDRDPRRAVGKLTRPEDEPLTAPVSPTASPRPIPPPGRCCIVGAEPGDALVVEVLGIELDDQGFVTVKPDAGLVQGVVNRAETHIVTVRDGQVHFGKLRLPVRPMIGVMATKRRRKRSPPPISARTAATWTTTALLSAPVSTSPVRVPGGAVLRRRPACHDGQRGDEQLGRGNRRARARAPAPGQGCGDGMAMDGNQDRLWITTAAAPGFDAAARIATQSMMGAARRTGWAFPPAGGLRPAFDRRRPQSEPAVPQAPSAPAHAWNSRVRTGERHRGLEGRIGRKDSSFSKEKEAKRFLSMIEMSNSTNSKWIKVFWFFFPEKETSLLPSKPKLCRHVLDIGCHDVPVAARRGEVAFLQAARIPSAAARTPCAARAAAAARSLLCAAAIITCPVRGPAGARRPGRSRVAACTCANSSVDRTMSHGRPAALRHVDEQRHVAVRQRRDNVLRLEPRQPRRPTSGHGSSRCQARLM